MAEKKKAGVTGVGGIFFKCRDKDSLKNWYRDHLGFNTDDYGATFSFHEYGKPESKAYLQWSPFTNSTDYFHPSEKEFMINYRVDNITELVQNLKAAGVKVLDEIEEYEYGKFVHIMDEEGNKIELWEPVDKAFDK